MAAALGGTLYALWLYGLGVVDPTSVRWLLHGDPAQHFVGLSFFLSESWHWPPGAILRFGDDPTSVVFTDSIPLLALIAKAGGLPPGAQYFGLWIVACHALVAGFGALLLRRLGASAAAAFVGAMFFASAPVVLLRAYGHEALMGQFFVVAALAAAFGRWKTLAWAALLTGSVLVHPYLAAMVFAIAVAAAAASLQQGTPGAPVLLRSTPVLLGVPLLAAWLAGYFVGSADRSAAGHGFFSANALTWFDPMDWQAFLLYHGRDSAGAGEWSALLPPLQQATAGQYEGFAYLGAGVLALVVAAVLSHLFGMAASTSSGSRATGTNGSRAQWAWILVACVAMALLALSARPSIGSHILFEVPLDEAVQHLLGIFRASGRFVWPLTWLLIAWAIARVARSPGAPVWLAAALLLQIVDLAPKHGELRERFRAGPPDAQALPDWHAWAKALNECPRLEWLEDAAHGAEWITPAFAAARWNAQLVDAPTARRSAAAAKRHADAIEALREGKGWRDDTLYVGSRTPPTIAASGAAAASPDFSGVPPGFAAASIDGYRVLAAPRCLRDNAFAGR
ncbi:MAG TPA: DUF6311 domain-containing protein [Zeimonas sp.]